MTELFDHALSELMRRRRTAAQAVGRGTLSLPAATAAIAKWCSIAAYFGAVLPAELRVHESFQTPLDHSPPGTSARDWLTIIAQQLRADAVAQLTRAEADPTRIPRARALLALDRELSVAAGLPPFPAFTQPQQEAA